MATNAAPTFILKEMKTFPLKVELAIPPERPVMRGYITCDALVRSKEEMRSLAEENLEDPEYFDRLIQAVHGISNEAGTALTGEEALEEVKNGRFSMYFLPAIIGAYFEQYGEARQKNLRKSLRR